MNTLLLVLVAAALVLMLLFSTPSDPGCGGDCRQGRRDCDCKDKE